jgi:hypothetical protein
LKNDPAQRSLCSVSLICRNIPLNEKQAYTLRAPSLKQSRLGMHNRKLELIHRMTGSKTWA